MNTQKDYNEDNDTPKYCRIGVLEIIKERSKKLYGTPDTWEWVFPEGMYEDDELDE